MAVVERYIASAGVITGIILSVASFVSIVLGIVSIVFRTALFIAGTGIWMGVALAIAAAFGIATKTKKKCLIITYMVFTIMAAVGSCCCVIHFIQSAVADAILGENRCLWPYESYGYDTCCFGTYGSCSSKAARVAIAVLLAFVYLVALIVSIVGSGFTCAGVCCTGANNAPQQTKTIVQQGTGMQPQPHIIQQQQMTSPVAIPGQAAFDNPPAYAPGAAQTNSNDTFGYKQ